MTNDGGTRMASSVTTKYLQSQIRTEFKRKNFWPFIVSGLSHIIYFGGSWGGVTRRHSLKTNMRRNEMAQN